MHKRFKKMKNAGKHLLLLGMIAGFTTACSDDNGNKVPAHDPAKKVEITDFYPKEGGMMSGIIISGSNFGNKPEDIRVYFNEKKAVITGTSGDKIQALAPRLPGEICNISVVVGKDSLVFDEKYNYITNYNLSVYCGQPGSTTGDYVEGTLAGTQFRNNLHFLFVDPNDHLYIAPKQEGKPLVYVNEEEDYTRMVFTGGNSANAHSVMGGTYVPDKDKLVFISHKNGFYWELDPNLLTEYSQKQILTPSNDQIAEGYINPTSKVEWLYSLAYSNYFRPGDPLAYSDEGFLYTRTYNGMIVRFRLSNRVVSLLNTKYLEGTDNYITIDPYDNTRIYCSLRDKNRITMLDLTKDPNSDEFETNLIGLGGLGGHADGHVAVARLNYPHQIAVSKDAMTGKKIMYIADNRNNCIRLYDFETEIVTTIAGTPGKKGLILGSPEESVLDGPVGVAVNSQGDLYISDAPNRVVLKLSFQ